MKPFRQLGMALASYSFPAFSVGPRERDLRAGWLKRARWLQSGNSKRMRNATFIEVDGGVGGLSKWS